MNIVCLDMEGVITPEIWIQFSKESGIPELKRTTRDEPDYDKLMRWRIGILKEHGLGLKEIQDTISRIDPLPGAKEFLDELRGSRSPIGKHQKLLEKFLTHCDLVRFAKHTPEKQEIQATFDACKQFIIENQ